MEHTQLNINTSHNKHRGKTAKDNYAAQKQSFQLHARILFNTCHVTLPNTGCDAS